MKLSLLESKIFGKVCYGFRREKNKRIEIVEQEAEIVWEIFALCLSGNSRPLAKLGKTIKIADSSNQRKAKCEAMPAVAIAFRENAKPFDKADGVFNKDTFT